MKKFLILLFLLPLYGEYPGQPGVIYYNSNNYWNMDAGSLSTKILHSDSIRALHARYRKADIETLSSIYSHGNMAEYNVFKGGISSRPGGKGGILTFRFDDGYRSNLNTFAPVFALYGVKAVIGIVAAIPAHVNDPSDTFMTWSEIRELAHDYGWEIACHSYDHTHGSQRDDYWVSWLNTVKAKKVIEDSADVQIVSYIAPSGDPGGWDDYFFRKEYWCAMMTSQGYNDFGNIDLYRLKIIQPPVDMQMIADSGYWAIRFFHAGSQEELEEAESLIVRARRLGVEILTPKEVIEKYGLLDISPIRITWDIETDESFQWLSTWGDSILDATDPDTSKFEIWDNNNLIGWTINGTYDSVRAETLMSNAPSEANNVTIPTPTTIHVYMQVGDSISLSRTFESPDSIKIAYLTFYTIWRNAFSPYGWSAWWLEDLDDNLFWKDDTKEWVNDTTYNSFPYSTEPGCRRKGVYVYDILPHHYKFTFHYRKDYSLSEAYFDDLSLTASATGTVNVKIMFKQANAYNTQIQSEIDMLFNNGVGPILTSPSGNKYRLKVDDSGNLSTESVP